MANLPYERTTEGPPSIYCGVYMFGPFYTKERRSELKRNRAMFVCLARRVVHIEVTHQIENDSFIQALRRMIARRGHVRLIQSDNCSNFLVAKNELKRAYLEMDNEKISQLLQNNGVDWIKWIKKYVCSQPHRWCLARSIVLSLLKNHSQSLNDESFPTLMTEVERIMNSRPLTVQTLSDDTSYKLLPSSDLLTMKWEVVLPPAVKLQKEDLYTIKYWERVQHLVNDFWYRWGKEVLFSFQERQKWHLLKQNLMISAIFLLKIDPHRSNWPMAKIIRVCSDKNGTLQNFQLLVGSCNGTKKAIGQTNTQNSFTCRRRGRFRFPKEEIRKNQDDMIT